MAANNFNYFDHYEDMLKKYGTKAKYILTQTSRKPFVYMQIRENIERQRVNTAEVTLTFPVYRYVQDEERWKKWECSINERHGGSSESHWGHGKRQLGVNIVVEKEFRWIDQGIWNYIDAYAKGNADDSINTFTGSALYWVVLKETDFKPQKHKNFPRISGTQVYVGRAASGIRKRWTTDRHNHCQNMFKIFKDDESKPLVDARLLLANLRRERRCIFVLPLPKEQLENEEARHIYGQLKEVEISNGAEAERWTPVNVKYGMNMRRESVQHDSIL